MSLIFWKFFYCNNDKYWLLSEKGVYKRKREEEFVSGLLVLWMVELFSKFILV